MVEVRSDSMVHGRLSSLRRDCFVKTPRLPWRGDSATLKRCRDCFNRAAKTGANVPLEANPIGPMGSQIILKSHHSNTQASGLPRSQARSSGPFRFESSPSSPSSPSSLLPLQRSKSGSMGDYLMRWRFALITKCPALAPALDSRPSPGQGRLCEPPLY